MNRLSKPCLSLFVCACASGAAAAQSLTGNVGSAGVSEGERAAEARVGFDDAGNAAARVQYEQAFSGWYQLRAIAVFRQPEDGGWDYSGLTVENWFQWAEESRDGAGFNGGLRLAYTLADGDGGDEAAARLTLTDRFAEGWEWRANLIASAGTSDDAESGVDLESRLQLTRSLPGAAFAGGTWRLGAELFSEYGNSRDIPGLDQQAHQFGPILKAEWDNGVHIQVGARAGLTEGADDAMVKFFLGREF